MGKVYNFKTFVILFILSGIYALIFSDSGLIERIDLQKKRGELEKRLGILKSENEELASRYEFYRNGGLTRNDLARSGYVKSGEKLIFMQGFENEQKPNKIPEERIEKENPPLKHLQIIWVVISILVLLFYFSRINKSIKVE